MAKLAEIEARQVLEAIEKWYSALHATRKPDIGAVPLDAIYSDASVKTASLLDRALDLLAESHTAQLLEAGYEHKSYWKQEVVNRLNLYTFPEEL